MTKKAVVGANRLANVVLMANKSISGSSEDAGSRPRSSGSSMSGATESTLAAHSSSTTEMGRERRSCTWS
jgi:hypothetical protein